MAGFVTRVDALEATLLPEGTSPPSTAILLRVQHLEDICLGARTEGALLARVQALEEACFGQADGPPGGAQQAFTSGGVVHDTPIAPIGRGVSEWTPQPAAQAAGGGRQTSGDEDQFRIFVGDLPADVESEELHITFGAFGGVNDVHVMRGKAKSGRSCAFVVFDSWEAGDRAIGALSGICCLREGDQPMGVSRPKSQTTRGPDRSAAVRFTADVSQPTRAADRASAEDGHGSVTKLFVGNLPAEVESEALQEVFGTYGIVTCIHVMAGKSASGQSCAFVEYATPPEAETAIHHLHQKYEALPGQGHIIVKYANGDRSRSRPY